MKLYLDKEDTCSTRPRALFRDHVLMPSEQVLDIIGGPQLAVRPRVYLGDIGSSS